MVNKMADYEAKLRNKIINHLELLEGRNCLLYKYIKYVKDCEGTDFLDHCENRAMSDIKFTEDEWDLLVKLSKER